MVALPDIAPASITRLLAACEVVPHPGGGWTIAVPDDATQTSVRHYRGIWETREAAAKALERIRWP
jgi:hypothetical protein